VKLVTPEPLTLRIQPCTLRQANAFVQRFHRHHRKSPGHRFSVAITDGQEIRGVAICGRPVSRHLDDGLTIEVNRCCTDGVPNGCSMLYGAARRIAREMGYVRLITYILESESGTSLKAAGWKQMASSRGGTWSRVERERQDQHPLESKTRWEVDL
jgi:hypothetical protein